MSIALVIFLVIVVFTAGYLLWKSRDTWRWFHITGVAVTLLLAIILLFPTAVVLKSRVAWNKLKEELDQRLTRVEAEQALLKYGDPNDPVAGAGVLELQSQLQRYTLEAGRRWPNLRFQGQNGGITLVKPPADANLAPGIEPDAAAPVPAAPVAAQPLIPTGLIVYGFAESAQPGVAAQVPTYFLGEFKVTASDPNQITLVPVGELEGPQQQAIASGNARSWTLYELLPLDGHVPFIAQGSEPTDDAVFGRVDDELVNRLLGNNVTDETRTEYLRDGGRVNDDDPPSTRWVKIEFTKPFSIVVDSLEKRNVLDGGFFDNTGQSVDSRLQRPTDDKGSATFKTGDQIVVLETAANDLIDQDVAKLLDTYYIRRLHDYRFVLRQIRLRIAELAIRQEQLTYKKQVLQDAIAATVTMITTNQTLKLKLENDLAKIQVERAAIADYTAKAREKIADTRQKLVGIYNENLSLVEELKQIHIGIANSIR